MKRICRIPILFNDKVVNIDIQDETKCPFYQGYDRLYQGQMCQIGAQYFDQCFLYYPDKWRQNEKLVCPFQVIQEQENVN